MAVALSYGSFSIFGVHFNISVMVEAFEFKFGIVTFLGFSSCDCDVSYLSRLESVSCSDVERHRVFDTYNYETRVREFDQPCVALVFVYGES